MDGDLRKHHARWCKSLQRAVETDGWGQVVEAVEAYERLAAQLVKEASQLYELSKTQARTIESVAGSLEMRAKCLSAVADGEHVSPTKDDMDDILEVLCSVLSDEPKVFPVDLGNVRRPAKRTSTVQVVDMGDDSDNDNDDDDEDALVAAAAATLALDAASAANAATPARPLAVRRAGETYVSLTIAKIGLKDASMYMNPTVVVSVFDRDGHAMSESVETPVGTHDSSVAPLYVSFDTSAPIDIEPSVQDMETRGAAVFFAFYHYKPKKRKKSCRCWAMLEMDEVVVPATGPAAQSTSDDIVADKVLELYAKPMDPTRKRIHLFTIKQLFLHVQLTLRTHTAIEQ